MPIILYCIKKKKKLNSLTSTSANPLKVSYLPNKPSNGI